MDNSDNEEMTISKKELTSPERFLNNIIKVSNNKINKIPDENKLIQQKQSKNKIINESKNVISKSFGNKKKSKDKLKKDDKRLHK